MVIVGFAVVFVYVIFLLGKFDKIENRVSNRKTFPRYVLDFYLFKNALFFDLEVLASVFFSKFGNNW